MSGFLPTDFSQSFLGTGYSTSATGGTAITPATLVTTIDFRTASKSAGLFTSIPSWFSISCATTSRTVQTSAASMVSGLGANALRTYSADGSTFGCAIENSSKNWDLNTETGASYTVLNGAALVSSNSNTAPDGNATADRFSWTTTANSLISTAQASTAGAGACGSMWVLAQGSTTQIESFDGAAGAWNDVKTINSSTWVRLDSKRSPNGSPAVNYWGHHGTVAAGSSWLWGAQLEDLLYPTSYIPNTTTARTRAADVVSATASSVCLGGYFHVKIIFAPLYADTENTTDHNLFYLDANNRIFLQQNTKKIVLRIGGSNISSAALTWARNTAITVEAIHSSRTGRNLIVNGTSTTGSVASAISLPASAYILGSNTGPEEGASLQYISFYSV